jgi:hypothetical protein
MVESPALIAGEDRCVLPYGNPSLLGHMRWRLEGGMLADGRSKSGLWLHLDLMESKEPRMVESPALAGQAPRPVNARYYRITRARLVG